MDTDERVAHHLRHHSFEAGARELHEKLGLSMLDDDLEHGFPINSFFLCTSLAAIAELIAGLGENNAALRDFLLTRPGFDERKVMLACMHLSKILNPDYVNSLKEPTCIPNPDGSWYR